MVSRAPATQMVRRLQSLTVASLHLKSVVQLLLLIRSIPLNANWTQSSWLMRLSLPQWSSPQARPSDPQRFYDECDDAETQDSEEVLGTLACHKRKVSKRPSLEISDFRVIMLRLLVHFAKQTWPAVTGATEHDTNDNVTTETENTFHTAHMNTDT